MAEAAVPAQAISLMIEVGVVPTPQTPGVLVRVGVRVGVLVPVAVGLDVSVIVGVEDGVKVGVTPGCELTAPGVPKTLFIRDASWALMLPEKVTQEKSESGTTPVLSMDG